MNWHRDSIFQGRYQIIRSLRFQKTSHIFNGNNIGTSFFKLFRHIYVVVQVVFCTSPIKDIASVAQCNFSYFILCTHFIDSNMHIIKTIQAIKYAENINTISSSPLNELTNYVVWIRCVTYSISTAKKHLKQCIWNFATEHAQTLPWIFMQESIRYVECSPAPTF